MATKSLLLALLGLCIGLACAKFDDRIFYDSSELFVEGNTIIIKNLHRPGGYLKFSINGANIQHVTNFPSMQQYDIEMDNFNSFFIEQRNITDTVRELFIRWDTGPLYQREICFHYGFNDASWFSTYEEIDQFFPMNTSKVQERAPFRTTDYFQGPFGSVLETLFLTTDGFSVHFKDSYPALLRRDPNNGDPLLCWTCDQELNNVNPIKVDILMGKNIREVYDLITTTNLTRATIEKPSDIPSERMFKDPVWSTWVEYKKGVNQDKVLEFAKAVHDHGFPASQIEIDDKWEKFYGDLTFDTEKFSNAKSMVENITALGYPTTLWIHPFVNQDSEQYSKNLKYFIQNENKTGPQPVKWWDGNGAGIDFTNPEAGEWFLGRLNSLKNLTGIESFKFDAGERYWFGEKPKFHDERVQYYHNFITSFYVGTVAKMGKNIEVRSSYRNQNQPIFTRLMDRNAVWDEHNGVRSVISGALTFSLAGYSFILPDMIGGNGKKPSAEMFIRWVQATALLPSMQFSITPWRYAANESTVNVEEITKNFVRLHQNYSSTIIQLAKERSETGHPIIRPMWWLEPNDAQSYKVGDQFMLGNDIVVAPIVYEGKTSRQVYLPTGKWKNHRNEIVNGPGLHETMAELSELPLFTRIQETDTTTTTTTTTHVPSTN